MKKIFSFYCCVLLSIAAWGDVTKVTVDGIKYILEGSNATVTYPNDSQPGTSEYTGDIVIPATITVDANDYNVTAIGDYAFRKASISSLTIGENVTSIGFESLYKVELKSLTIPGNVTTIGENSLRESQIKTLILNEGLETIGKRAIYGTKITELTVPNSVTNLKKEAIAYNDKLKKITFGTHIADNTWENWVCWRASGAYEVYMMCDAVPELSDDITFDNEHKSRIHVKPSVFDDFVADSKWNIYNIITELGTIDGIKYLKDGKGNAYVTYPNDTEPGTSSYEGDIVIPSTVSDGSKEYKVIAIEDKAFRKASITSLSIPESVTSIGKEALYKTALTSLTIPGSVTTIGQSALKESSINSLTLNEGLLTIEKEAIYGTKIAEITIPNSVTTLGESCLSENSSLTTVVFGKNVSANKWGAWVCWRSSGAYDVYMICDTKPTLADNQTFDDSHKSTIHVMSSLEDSYNADSNWGGQYTIVGDLEQTYFYMQNVIAENEAFLANEVGTDPGFKSSANPTALSTAITAAKALTKSASADDIESAISAMNSAKDDYTVNPLTAGYYYIENLYTEKMAYTDPAYAENGGIKAEDKATANTSKAKFYFQLTSDGDNWIVQGIDHNNKIWYVSGLEDDSNTSGKYIKITTEPVHDLKITNAGIGKFKIQCLYDNTNSSYPYTMSTVYTDYAWIEDTDDEERTFWRFHTATFSDEFKGILTEAEVKDKIDNTTGTYLKLDKYAFIAEDLTSNMPENSNLLVKVKTGSSITGTNIINNKTCANLVLTDGQPFGYTEDITATTASYSRTVTNKFGTICLPYAVSSNEDVQYYTLDRKEGSTLYLTKQDDIAAGVPAVFENLSEGTTLNASATSTTIKGSVPAAADATLKLIGTFQELVITDAEELAKDYYISGGKFRQATSSLTVKPFRAYFTTTSGSGVKMFNLSVLEEEETAIDNVQCSILNAQSIYDANGMKLTSLRKGLNIVKMADGGVQKVMVK